MFSYSIRRFLASVGGGGVTGGTIPCNKKKGTEKADLLGTK